ncbi:hypothetical protein LSCM4_02790 [Leishmania orientalis]|uniref:Ankyrin repeat protein n=1 Tax=Leishmania orientalis TaxID=2249476 RepID=A0A836H3B7_9TRYP|nr:hypothetical protein LSCM4_02790 [Leishmania orientalis]
MNSDGPSAFHHALQLLLSPLEDPFRRYLDVCDDVHMRDANRNTMLHWAAALGNVAAAYALLEHGVEVDAQNVYGATPLHAAAAFGPNVGVMCPLLMRYGASLTKRTSRNASGVESLLTSRDLTAVWTWILQLEALVEEKEGGTASSFRSGGSCSLPSVASIKAMPPLLCAPEELRELSQDPRGGTHRSCPTVSLHTTRIPRAPARRLPAHAGAAHLLTQQQPTRLTSSRAAAVTAVFSATITSEASPRSAPKERDTEVTLCVFREEAGRMQLEKDQAEALVEMCMLLSQPRWFPCSHHKGDREGDDRKIPSWLSPLAVTRVERNPDGEDASARLSGFIMAVLGEKYDGKGGRQLLVQYNASPGSEETRIAEAWCPLSSVARDPVVIAYIDRYSRTYTSTNPAGIETAATPSILNTDGGAGSPLDTMEREQLEEQLRMLPRRNLSSRDSCSSLTVSARLSNPITPRTRKSGQVCKMERDDRLNDVLTPQSRVVVADGRVSHAAAAQTLLSRELAPAQGQVWCEESDSFSLSRFTQSNLQKSSRAQEAWVGKAPSRVPQPTRGEDDAQAARETVFCELESHALASGFEQPNAADTVTYVCCQSPFHLKEDISAESSTAHTHPPGSSSNDSASGFRASDGRYYLSPKQKATYNSFLRDSALQRLQKRQERLSSRALGG